MYLLVNYYKASEQERDIYRKRTILRQVIQDWSKNPEFLSANINLSALYNWTIIFIEHQTYIRQTKLFVIKKKPVFV